MMVFVACESRTIAPMPLDRPVTGRCISASGLGPVVDALNAVGIPEQLLVQCPMQDPE